MDKFECCKTLLRATQRPNMEELIEFITQLGYFIAPGSMKHHRYKGGLVSHSLETYYEAMNLRSIKIAKGIKEETGSYVAIGIAGIFLFHTLENIGMTMGLLPITGVPLLFVSYGGTSMLTSSILIGILLNISSQRKNGLFNK